jgi:hypothetical protein
METKQKSSTDTQEEIHFFKGNREEWLNKVADFIYDKIEEEFVCEVNRDVIKLSMGFMPKGNAKAIGVCHYEEHSEGDVREIFICPTRTGTSLADSIETAQIVAHEVTHAILPVGTGHNNRFKKIIMDYLGAEGIPTATVAGAQFTLLIQDFIKELGLLPHYAIKQREGAGSTTVAVKCTGAEACVGASDKSIAQGFGLISRVSMAVYKKVGDNFRCMACGSSTVVDLPLKLRKDYQ